jgi:hypothetical protein
MLYLQTDEKERKLIYHCYLAPNDSTCYTSEQARKRPLGFVYGLLR